VRRYEGVCDIKKRSSEQQKHKNAFHLRIARIECLSLMRDSRAIVSTSAHALKNWFVAQCYDALIVGVMWGIGLFALRVPLAPLWALLGAAFQFVPNLGPILTLVGPVAIVALSGSGWMKLLYLLILYVGIVIIDGLWLQPIIMKRSVKVPLWASILVPIVAGIVIPFWGVLLAPPLLAVFYAFRSERGSVAR
jgi:predicted PurR-regulated permease PerM